MTIKEKIIFDIKNIVNPALLSQLFEFLQLLKKEVVVQKGNREAVLAFAGILSNEDAADLQRIIQDEFNQIEGDW